MENNIMFEKIKQWYRKCKSESKFRHYLHGKSLPKTLVYRHDRILYRLNGQARLLISMRDKNEISEELFQKRGKSINRYLNLLKKASKNNKQLKDIYK